MEMMQIEQKIVEQLPEAGPSTSQADPVQLQQLQKKLEDAVEEIGDLRIENENLTTQIEDQKFILEARIKDAVEKVQKGCENVKDGQKLIAFPGVTSTNIIDQSLDDDSFSRNPVLQPATSYAEGGASRHFVRH